MERKKEVNLELQKINSVSNAEFKNKCRFQHSPLSTTLEKIVARLAKFCIAHQLFFPSSFINSELEEDEFEEDLGTC